MSVIRTVTGHDAGGQAIIASAGPAPGSEPFQHIPGFFAARVWHTASQPVIEDVPEDRTGKLESLLPAPGGTTALMVTFPPDQQAASADGDPQQAGLEFCERLPGLAQRFEADGSGFHQTDTIDYGVVVEGEIWLDLGNGHEKRLQQGEVVVQVGTRHAWRNRSDRPARLFFVLIGAQRTTGGDA